jgi:hypothetical protein
VVADAYAAIVRSLTTGMAAPNIQARTMEAHVADHSGRHPDAERYRSQPGLGDVLAARVLAEFDDDPGRYAGARSRNNYAGDQPNHSGVGKEARRAGPLRPQPSAG